LDLWDRCAKIVGMNAALTLAQRSHERPRVLSWFGYANKPVSGQTQS